jgi:hypothetical protein
MRAWNLGLDKSGWTDVVMEEADQLTPTLVKAGYAATDDVAQTWWFTDEGVARAEAIEKATDRPQL